MILLTGATGFVGKAVASALSAAGKSFVALVRETSDVSDLGGVDLRYGDVNDPQSLLEAFDGVVTIIHTAAVVSFQPEDREQMLFVNGEGTANLVNMALEAGVRRVIHLSSVAALNRRDGGPEVTLKDRWPETRPNTSYGESKFAGEREVWRGQAEGLEVAVLYPSLILGKGDFDGHNTPSLWRMAAKERGFYPEGTTGIVALDDVVEAVLATLDRDEDGDRFLLNAANWSWHTVLANIAESIGAKAPTRSVARWQSAFLWPVEKLRAKMAGSKPMITKESHRNVQAKFSYDGSVYAELTGKEYREVGEVVREIGEEYLVHCKLSFIA
jgi:dihydroflavonol-4-reductase